MQIGGIPLQNNVIMAPMAGITNQAFRAIIATQGVGMLYSEMVSDKAIVYCNQKTMGMLGVAENEHPFAMQLFGHDVDSMVAAARYLEEHTLCDVIDINMGCPMLKVTSNGSGSALMKDPQQVYAIVQAIVQAVKKPVTVKMRAGWSAESINAVEIALLCEKAGASAVAVHGRTRNQMYEGQADWNIIRQVKEAVHIPVIGNGDVHCYEEKERMIQETGCDAVMVGRAVLGNPWLIRELITGEKQEPDAAKRLAMLLEHTEKLIALKGEKVAVREMRGQAGWYLLGLPHNNRMKDLLAQVRTRSEILDLVDSYRDIVTLDKDAQKEAMNELVKKHCL